MTKVYISGPITGHEDHMEHFQRAEEYLREEGYCPINPAAVGGMMPSETTWKEFMELSIFLMDMCDAIYMLEGWEKSCGANQEYGYAMGRGKIILFEEGKWEK